MASVSRIGRARGRCDIHWLTPHAGDGHSIKDGTVLALYHASIPLSKEVFRTRQGADKFRASSRPAIDQYPAPSRGSNPPAVYIPSLIPGESNHCLATVTSSSPLCVFSLTRQLLHPPRAPQSITLHVATSLSFFSNVLDAEHDKLLDRVFVYFDFRM
jgi:hypothetical protein